MKNSSRRLKKNSKWLIAFFLIMVTLFLSKYIQSNKYLVLNSIIDFEDQIKIPKIEKGWIPQGICKTEDYIFVSAYDPKMEEGKSGEDGRPSVVFVIGNETNKHIKTLTFEGEVEGQVIDLRSHFGAIDYAKENNNLYIADSTNGILWQVSMDTIDSAIEEEGKSAKVSVETILVERELTISFLTYHNGLLYIGQHDKDSESENFMIGYDLSNNEAKTDKIPLHLKSQGVTFINYKDQLYLLNSCSRGVDNPSALVAEKVKEEKDDKGNVILKKDMEKELVLPNMSEDLYADGENVYICFESAAKYYNKGLLSLFTEKRHILVINMESILKKNSED